MILLTEYLILVYLVAKACGISTNVTVDGLGNAIGLQETTQWTNRTIYAFRGIPYAEPPVGDLRFRQKYALQGLRASGGNKAVIQAAGTQRLLEEDSSALLARGEYSQMPMIGSATKHDGSMLFAAYYVNYFLPLGLDTDRDYLKYNMTDFITAVLDRVEELGLCQEKI